MSDNKIKEFITRKVGLLYMRLIRYKVILKTDQQDPVLSAQIADGAIRLL